MPKTSVPAKGDPLPALTRRSLLAGAATLAATVSGAAQALPMSTPDLALAALEREFTRGLFIFEAAHKRYSACEKRYFALCRRGQTKAARARIRRQCDVPAAEAAADASVEALWQVMQRMAAAPARSPAGLAVKARAVKRWAYPEWWDANAEVPERLAAQVLDAVMEMAGIDPEAVRRI
jgi:hypothetical protein